MDCVFCAVNNKVRTYAHGKLMSNHKDLGKSFASGHRLFTLAGRGPGGHGEMVILQSRRVTLSCSAMNKDCTQHITIEMETPICSTLENGAIYAFVLMSVYT